MHTSTLTIGTATVLGLVGIASLPAILLLTKQVSKPTPKSKVIYEDKDGKSTSDAVEAYSAKLPKIAIILLAGTGFALTISIAVLVTLRVGRDGLLLEDWLSSGASAFILFQALAIVISRSSVEAYNLGCCSFFSAAVLSVELAVQDGKVFNRLPSHLSWLLALRVISLGVYVLLAVASITIPRRPAVFDERGRPIDAMLTGSALNRFTWGWPAKVLATASKKNNLELTDLPRLDHYTRAADLSADWQSRASKQRLWLAVISAHKVALSVQWGLTLVTSVLNFAPQYVVLQILRRLETHDPSNSHGWDVWVWVIWLGVAIIAQSWTESYIFWISFSELAIPIRGQLSALIFEKSMRRKDVKGTGRSSNKKAQEVEAIGLNAPITAGVVTGAADKPELPEEEDEAEALKKSKQSTVNLIGVDTKRVSDCSAFQNMFPGSLFKLIVSLAFLADLLGWKALLAGFSTMLAIMPCNAFFAKRYAAAQDSLMKVRDEKTGVVTEALQGIRQIKFSALESEWEDKIDKVREKELKSVWNVFMADTALLACWVTSPIALAAVSLAVYAAIHGELLPSVAFVSLGVFRALEITLSVIPELTTDVLDAWTSIQRIEAYLNSPEIGSDLIVSPEIVFDNTSIAWPADEDLDDQERFVLRDITVTFPKGELSVISGHTGAGKSLMLAAILGEVDILSGNIGRPKAPSLSDRRDANATKANWIVPGAIAYVAQIPWIENASIKDNIIFGLPVDEARYSKTLDVCALSKDLAMLSDGENTEIGANGINLSGGQKWRVTLARAIYSRAEILVLDDIFSAVDATTGRHIFEKCLTGELASTRTRILVTHHVTLCEPRTKYVVQLGDGRVQHAGLVSELQEDGTLELIKTNEQTLEMATQPDDENATAVNSSEGTDDETSGDMGGDTLKKIASKTAAKKFVEDEKREQGAVTKHVYGVYLKDSGGLWFWAGCFVVFLIVQIGLLGRSWWLKIWTGTYEENEASTPPGNATSRQLDFTYTMAMQQNYLGPTTSQKVGQQHGLEFYLGIYIGLATLLAIIGTLRFLYTYVGSIRASRTLFRKLNFIVLRAPLRWLDTVPVGRILNRFTSDFSIIDSNLANSVSFGGSQFLELIAVIVATLFVSPYLVLLAFVLLAICLHYALVYLRSARPIKRLESTTKSPVFEQFGSALTGVATIRGFDKSESYVTRMFDKVDDWDTATWNLWLVNRWMGWRMSLVGSTFSVFVTALILLSAGIDAALAGFALTFALSFSSYVMWTVRLYANLELNMNAAERIIEYTELPTESLEGAVPPAAWPTEGRVDVDNLVISYASDLPPVLKGLSFSVNRNERVGVVGRTGAGKSSLTLALFRFLEASSGSIHVDGLDISKIKLHDLRSRLAIIPQDPVLFSGSVRSNLDPFKRHTDNELRDALERVHLIKSASTEGTATPVDGDSTPTAATRNANVFEDLTSPISEGGLNLSQGQRQLLCLARAIVARPKVMVLDEATSAVDMATDALIQRSIREEFTDATLLVIAHRLSTIADFGRILVLSEGTVAEYGTPRELWDLGKDKGIFRSMCEESGEKDKLRSIVYGEQ